MARTRAGHQIADKAGVPACLLRYPGTSASHRPLSRRVDSTARKKCRQRGNQISAGLHRDRDDGQVLLDSSREAALALSDDGSGPLVSLWQNNLIGIRAERFVHWMRRRDGCVVVPIGVEY